MELQHVKRTSHGVQTVACALAVTPELRTKPRCVQAVACVHAVIAEKLLVIIAYIFYGNIEVGFASHSESE